MAKIKNRPAIMSFSCIRRGIKNVDFNFEFSFFCFAENGRNRRCTEIDFNFQFLMLDENQRDENHTDTRTVMLPDRKPGQKAFENERTVVLFQT